MKLNYETPLYNWEKLFEETLNYPLPENKYMNSVTFPTFNINAETVENHPSVEVYLREKFNLIVEYENE